MVKKSEGNPFSTQLVNGKRFIMFWVKFIQEHMDANMAQEVNISIKIDILAFLRLKRCRRQYMSVRVLKFCLQQPVVSECFFGSREITFTNCFISAIL